MFHSLKYIRVLDLNSGTLVELPSSVEELKPLRYLDLSRAQIKVLLNSMCNLYNLQTLKTSRVPLALRIAQGLRMLPSKMGNLTTLKNLSAFLASDTSGHGIKELKDVAYLTSLHMLKLGKAVDEADSKLNEKGSLQKQVLEWSGRAFNEQDKVEAARGLKDLKRYPNLEELAIRHFVGSNFPSWMTDGLLQNLVTLSLNHCTKCKIISLVQLPCLRELYIKGMQELEDWQEDQYTSLCTLHIINCPKLRKVPNLMSNLRVLKLKKCGSLKALPMAPSLMLLILINNLVLEDWKEGSCIAQYDQGNQVGQPRPALIGLLELKMVNCPKIRELSQLYAPQKLEISGYELVSAVPEPQFAQRLQHLALDTCSNVTLVRAISNTNSLCFLVISNISNLTSFPKLPLLPALKALYFSDCKCLTSLSEQKGSLRSLSSIQLLSIQGCSKLESLPDEGLPTALECLMIGSCPMLKSLGAKETLKSLLFLKDLYMEDCPLTQYFPAEGLPPSLQQVKIHGCPQEIEECQKEDAGATEWSKIMHVPDLEIDSINLSSTQMCQTTKHGFIDLFSVKAELSA
ncbi:disease resistance protein RGA2-like [Herrania umbratica]|uniref:Disease resistance protein RGA2-like n=1 Tax=Herrania umbratica TaxID=108875 RepID=A0A6J1A5E5_9ROSI|nr:disease resistance protein RGA2-like [Herrania umbratica]